MADTVSISDDSSSPFATPTKHKLGMNKLDLTKIILEILNSKVKNIKIK